MVNVMNKEFAIYKEEEEIDRKQELAEIEFNKEECENKIKKLNSEINRNQQALDFINGKYKEIDLTYAKRNKDIHDKITLDESQIINLQLQIDSIIKEQANIDETEYQSSDTLDNTENKKDIPKDNTDRKSIVDKYRRICSLCHPDKTGNRDFEKHMIAYLSSLYIDAQKVYKDRDLNKRQKENRLTIILEKAMNAIKDTSYTEEIKYEKTKNEYEMHIEELENKLSSLISNLEYQSSLIYYQIMKFHLNDKFESANTLYRNALLTKKQQTERTIANLIERIMNLKKQTV